MSVATELTRIQTAKADIKTAIENKGVTIPDNTLINAYSDYIDDIPTGGSSINYFTKNFSYLCNNNLSLIDEINNSNVYGKWNISNDPIEEEYVTFDVSMDYCFVNTIFENQDPIGLVNKVINASYHNYEKSNFSGTFTHANFSGSYENQTSKITFKDASGQYIQRSLYLNHMFSYCNISAFKDVELDFSNITNVDYIYAPDLFTGAITGDNGFKITNLPCLNLNGIYQLNSYSSRKVKIKKLTSNGEKLRYRLDLRNLDMTREVFMEFIDSLGAVTSGTITINIDSAVYNLLTSDDLAAVSAKKYNLSY